VSGASIGKSECNGCHTAIVWVRTARGRPMPLNADPVTVDVGALESQRPVLFSIKGEHIPLPAAGEAVTGHLCHFATCPEAEAFRQQRKKGGRRPWAKRSPAK